MTLNGQRELLPLVTGDLVVHRASSSFLLIKTFGAQLLWHLDGPLALITLQPGFANKVTLMPQMVLSLVPFCAPNKNFKHLALTCQAYCTIPTLRQLYVCMELFLYLLLIKKKEKKSVNSSIQGTRPVRNAYLEPAWWLHHPRRRCGKQCVIVCREIHNRALCFTERGSTWPLRHIHPEETVRRDSVLRHTQHHLSGSLLHVEC